MPKKKSTKKKLKGAIKEYLLDKTHKHWQELQAIAIEQDEKKVKDS
jgi:hypothetical protein